MYSTIPNGLNFNPRNHPLFPESRLSSRILTDKRIFKSQRTEEVYPSASTYSVNFLWYESLCRLASHSL